MVLGPGRIQGHERVYISIACECRSGMIQGFAQGVWTKAFRPRCTCVGSGVWAPGHGAAGQAGGAGLAGANRSVLTVSVWEKRLEDH